MRLAKPSIGPSDNYTWMQVPPQKTSLFALPDQLGCPHADLILYGHAWGVEAGRVLSSVSASCPATSGVPLHVRMSVKCQDVCLRILWSTHVLDVLRDMYCHLLAIIKY